MNVQSKTQKSVQKYDEGDSKNDQKSVKLLDDKESKLVKLENSHLIKGGKVVPCRKCEICKSPDCGNCDACLNKKKFGGEGVKNGPLKNVRCKTKICPVQEKLEEDLKLLDPQDLPERMKLPWLIKFRVSKKFSYTFKFQLSTKPMNFWFL